jgi:glycine/D-amino acid oxidase-like deaminating enzyme
MKVDYIIVGFGLAGMAFAETLERNGKSFIIFDDNPNRKSRVIGGMFNPVILKRFTPAWQAHEMWTAALPFYKELERKFDKTYIIPFKIRRILHAIEEQNNWVVASEKPVMSSYMQAQILKEEVKGIYAPFGYGVLNHVGRVDGEKILRDFKKHLKEKEVFFESSFDYNKLEIGATSLKYKDIEASKIVFSEGAYLHQNPFFNYLPMREAKGELLRIEVPQLDIDFTLKSGVFMVPDGANQFIVGATYNWTDKTFEHTQEAQEEIETQLKKFLHLPYTIIAHKIGIRPTIMDRRPLLGKHPKYPNLAVLNGLGTRGIIIAPSIAQVLFDKLENGLTIRPEMDCARFDKMWNQ